MLASRSPAHSPISPVFGTGRHTTISSPIPLSLRTSLPPAHHRHHSDSSPRSHSSPIDPASFAFALSNAVRQGQQQQTTQTQLQPQRVGLKRPWPSSVSNPATPVDERDFSAVSAAVDAELPGNATSESMSTSGSSNGSASSLGGFSGVQARLGEGRSDEMRAGRAFVFGSTPLAGRSTSLQSDGASSTASSSSTSVAISAGPDSSSSGGKRRKVSADESTLAEITSSSAAPIPQLAFPSSPPRTRTPSHSPKSSLSPASPSPRLRAPSAPNATLIPPPPASRLAERRQLNKKHLSLTVPPTSLLSVNPGPGAPRSPGAGAAQIRSAPGSPREPQTGGEQMDNMKRSLRGGLSMRRRTSIPGLPNLAIRPPAPGGNVGAPPPTPAIGGLMTIAIGGHARTGSNSSTTSSNGSTSSHATKMRMLRTEESRTGFNAEERERPVMTEEFPYSRGPRLILPGVWLGSEHNACDVEMLAKYGIGTVINVAKEVDCPWGEGKEMLIEDHVEEGGVDTITEEEDTEMDGEVDDARTASTKGSPPFRIPNGLAVAASSSSSSGLRRLRRTQTGLLRGPTAHPPPAHSSDARLRGSHHGNLGPPPTPSTTTSFPQSASRPLTVRATSSTPNLQASFRGPDPNSGTVTSENVAVRSFAANPHSGRPAIDYLWLPWTHDQENLVSTEFEPAFKFIDGARQGSRPGVLIHCQCGVSRSATLMIGYVMRQAVRAAGMAGQADGFGVSDEERVALADVRGMHAAYSYVKDRSEYIGPNIGLVYQLVEYERHLAGTSSAGMDMEGEADSEKAARRFPSEDEMAAAAAAMDVDSEETMLEKRRGIPIATGLSMRLAFRSPTAASISEESEATTSALGSASLTSTTPDASSIRLASPAALSSAGPTAKPTSSASSPSRRRSGHGFGHQQTASEPEGLGFGAGRQLSGAERPRSPPKQTPLRPLRLRTVTSDEALSPSNEALDLHGTPQRANPPPSTSTFLLPLLDSHGKKKGLSPYPNHVQPPSATPLEQMVYAPASKRLFTSSSDSVPGAGIGTMGFGVGTGHGRLAFPSGPRATLATSTPVVGQFKIPLSLPSPLETSARKTNAQATSHQPIFGAATQSKSERRAAHRRAFSADLQTLLARSLTVSSSSSLPSLTTLVGPGPLTLGEAEADATSP